MPLLTVSYCLLIKQHFLYFKPLAQRQGSLRPILLFIIYAPQGILYMPKKQRFQIRNWRDYNEALVKRGSITFWFDEKSISKMTLKIVNYCQI